MQESFLGKKSTFSKITSQIHLKTHLQLFVFPTRANMKITHQNCCSTSFEISIGNVRFFLHYVRSINHSERHTTALRFSFQAQRVNDDPLNGPSPSTCPPGDRCTSSAQVETQPSQGRARDGKVQPAQSTNISHPQSSKSKSVLCKPGI